MRNVVVRNDEIWPKRSQDEPNAGAALRSKGKRMATLSWPGYGGEAIMEEPRRVSAKHARRILIVTVPPSKALNVFGPAEVFLEANRLYSGSSPYEVSILSAGDGDVIQTGNGLRITTEHTFRNHVGAVDTLLVVGTEHPHEAYYEAELLQWLRVTAATSRRVGAVCTGAFVLAAAGLLDSRRATTHWQWCDSLARRHPNVRVEANLLYVCDANRYTSAGGTAGIDLALALIEEDLGSQLAMEVAQMMVVFLRRTGSQPQLSATLSAQKTSVRYFGDLLAWIADNLHSDLSISTLARKAAMSPRNFARLFIREVGTTPGKHIKALRLEAARRELTSASKSLTEVALASGFASTETLRRAFMKDFGVPPGRYRTCLNI